jgi:hypothetical protein
MENWQPTHPRLFNILGRIVGIVFLIGGLIISICGLASFSNPQVNSLDAWLMFLLPLLVAFLGFLLIKARPYRSESSAKNDNKET